MLDLKKRIILEMPCLEWLNKAIDSLGAQILPLTTAIAVESCHLPNHFHDDPVDRLIVASARVERVSIATRDKRILAYGSEKFVSVVKV